MKKLSLLQLGCVLGVFAGSAAYSQVFNMHNINQGFHNYGGYNVMMFGQGAYSDTGNNVWNGFDNPDSPGSTDSYGGGHTDDGLLSGNPGNPYAHSRNGYWAPNNGAATTPVLFAPANFTSTSAGNAYSSGTLSPITVPVLIRGFDSGTALDSGNRTSPEWIFSEATCVNAANPGQPIIPGVPLGVVVLSNVPAGTYSLYLYGANFDGTRGANFVVTNAGSTPLNGLTMTMNPNAAAGSGPLNTYVLGQDYVEYDNVVPDAHGVVGFTWGAISNVNSTLTGEGDFNGLQLVKDTAVLAPPSFAQQPFNSTFGGGTTATLFADARGNPAPTVEWWQTNANGTVSDTGQSGATLTFANFAAGNAGSYFAIATGTSTSVSSAVAVLGISTIPTIASQSPGATETLVAGQSLTLTVSATGPSPTYNWYSNGVQVATTSGTPTVVNNGTTVNYSATLSSTTIGPFAASCTLLCTVVNSYSPSGVSDTATAVTVIPQLTGTYDTFILGLNPIAYWPLNESSGTVAYNYSISGGPALDGTIQAFANAPNVLAVPGPALFGFSGANTGVSVGLLNAGAGNDLVAANYCGTMNVAGGEAGTGILVTNSALELTGNFTVVTWALIPTGLVLNNQGYLFGQQNSANGNAVFLGQNGNANWSTVNNANLAGGPTFADSQWHLWVFINNGHHGSNYIDNVLVESGSYHANASYSQNLPVTTIGSDSPGGYTRNWNGDLCRMAVFNTAFTAAQVAALYNGSGIQPIITVNPPALVVAQAGSTAALGDVSAAGSSPVSYQWYFSPAAGGGPNTLANGGRISGASGVTGTNLVISPVLASDAGTYYATAANGYGTPPTSTPVELTVNTTAASRIFAGQSPTFSMAAGAGPYVWKTNGVVDTTQTGNTYTLSTTAGQAPVAVFGENASSVYSITNTVTVIAAPTDPYPAAVLVDHPLAYFRLDEADNGTGNNGSPAFDYINGNNGIYSNATLGATGYPIDGGLTVNSDGAAQFGSLATSDSFAAFIPNIDFGLAASNSPAQLGNGEFSVEAWVMGVHGGNEGIVTKGYGGGNQTAPHGEQFSLQTSAGGGNFIFMVNDAAGDTANLTYVVGANTLSNDFVTPLWYHLVGVCDQTNGYIYLYRNGLLAGKSALPPGKGILSAPTTPLSIGAKQVHDASGNYTGQWIGTVDEVAIYNKALTSNEVLNHYFAAGIVPIFLVQPTNDPNIGSFGTTNAGLGSSVTLTALGFGSPALHYQWYDYNGGGAPIAVNAGQEPGNIGASTPTLTLKNVSTIAAGGTVNTIGSGVFEVIVSNPYGAVTSSIVSITPVSGPPSISPDLPATNYALIGGSAVFAVGQNGEFPQTNVWYYNNGAGAVKLADGGRITGSTTGQLTIANVTLADEGTYQLFVTNAISYPNGVSSSPSTLVVVLEPAFNGGSGWTLNANAGETLLPSISGDVLEITQNTGGQANSFFFDTPMYCGAFQASFTYQDVTRAGADGFSFCLQNDPAGTAALGQGGGEIGYGGAEVATPPYITNSVAVGFDIYNGHTIGCELLTGGNQTYAYGSVAPVSITSGDLINIGVNYDGNTITVSFADPTASTSYVTNYVIGPIAQYVGANTALVGFTGATGGVEAQQNISAFTYTPLPIMSAALSGNNAVITWPTAIGGYVLQSTHALPAGQTGPGAWATVPASSYSIVNGNYKFTVPTSNGTTYYQLFLP